MHLEMTFRHMNARPEIKRRADALFAKLHKFLDEAAEGHLTVGSEHGGTTVELLITTRGQVVKAEEADEDLRTALDRAFHRVEDQLRRGKEKHEGRRRRSGSPAEADGFGQGDADDDEVGGAHA